MTLTNITRTGFIVYVLLTVDGYKSFINALNEPTFQDWMKENDFFTADNKVMNQEHETIVLFERMEL